MNKLTAILKSKIFLLFLLAAFNVIIAIYYLKLPLFFSDSETYLSAMRYLQGQMPEIIPYNRLLTTPLLLYTSIFTGFFTGNLQGGLLAINLIFYFLAIFVFYKLALEIYKDAKTAAFSSILFLSNYAMYNFGTVYLADMGGWFFFLLGSFFALKYHNIKDKKFFFLAILAASIGVLFKETGALGIISLGMLILFSDSSLKKKSIEILKAGLLFLIIPALYYLLFYLKFHYSYLDWYFYNLNAPSSPRSLSVLIKVLGWVYLAGWPIFLLGLWQEKKFFSTPRIKILAALLPPSLSFLIWPALTQRIAFILVPWLALISGLGLSKIKNNYLTAVTLTLYALINFAITPVLIEVINLPF